MDTFSVQGKLSGMAASAEGRDVLAPSCRTAVVGAEDVMGPVARLAIRRFGVTECPSFAVHAQLVIVGLFRRRTNEPGDVAAAAVYGGNLFFMWIVLDAGMAFAAGE